MKINKNNIIELFLVIGLIMCFVTMVISWMRIMCL